MPHRATSPAISSPSAGLAVFVSGTGTLLEAIIQSQLPIALVLADRPCRGLDIAQAAGLATALVDRRDYGWSTKTWDRSGFTAAIIKQLRHHHIGLVAMAGFMTILSPMLFDYLGNRILNTHPALLPRFKGAHAVADALAAGVTETGCTVHIATPELDHGPILAQQTVPILPGDTEATLWERIKTVERILYPRVIRERLGL